MIGLLALAAATVAPAPPARPEMVVRCGAVERHGVATRQGDGTWAGRAVDLCRAAAVAARGPAARIDFHGYDDGAGLAAAPEDQIAFLATAELDSAPLRGRLRVGPVMAIEEQILLVPALSPVRRREDLAGRMICFMIGSAAEDALDAWAVTAGIFIKRLGFQEPDEMRDAYAVGKCAAMALDRVEASEDYGATAPANRVLDDELAQVAIMAATPVAADPAWQAIVDGLADSAPTP